MCCLLHIFIPSGKKECWKTKANFKLTIVTELLNKAALKGRSVGWAQQWFLVLGYVCCRQCGVGQKQFEKYYNGRVGCHHKSKLISHEMGAGLGTNTSSLQLFFFWLQCYKEVGMCNLNNKLTIILWGNVNLCIIHAQPPLTCISKGTHMPPLRELMILY